MNLSTNEQRVLEILGRKKMTISEITVEFYRGHQLPIFANNVISMVVRNINKKCVHNKSDWYLNGEGAGRAGRTVWREKR